eukprot:CAMPEP_0202392464 /NCGR_PEP_ID=MMETSP1127-20130417/92387_1 /ASSEMBLY_ACC=CAM_ASM_000462 /TAXON_ID=3047 /ORGANISM="Dunaliella tertiolecta, Strain CCMP1320" /LENGTH=95 /DNA_ID=CAMNT_0048994973 /DNA_START=429 /DNA_END=715 /DNA_ORIENTATION=+
MPRSDSMCLPVPTHHQSSPALIQHVFACVYPPSVMSPLLQSALDFDRQDPSHVDINEFVFIMEGLVSHIKDGAVLDELIAMLVEGQKVGSRAGVS